MTKAFTINLTYLVKIQNKLLKKLKTVFHKMENYEVISNIGKGSFGVVSKIKRKSDGKTLVWKELNYGKMSEKEKQQLVAEVNILRELRHSNIVRYYDR